MTARLFDKFRRVLPIALLLLYLAQFSAYVMGGGGIEPYVRSTDFMPTLAAAEIIAHGQGEVLYDLDVQAAMQRQVLAPYLTLAEGELLPFNHLPFEAFLILPFMSLPYAGITLYWVLLLALALAAALLLLQRTLPLKQPWLVIVVLCVISYLPLFRAFILGQNSPLVLLGICLAYAACRREGRRWDVWVGVGLVLVAFKPQVMPLALLLVLMEGRWKAILWFGALFGALVVMSMPLLGVLWPLDYLNLLLRMSSWGSTGAINPAIMHNWRGFATNTIGTFSPAGATTLLLVMTVISILLFVYAAWRARQIQQQENQQGGNRQRATNQTLLWALGVVTAVLVSPHLNPHDLTLLVFCGWVMAYFVQPNSVQHRLNPVWRLLLQALYLVVPLTFLAAGDAPIGVILNVTLLAISSGLLVWMLCRPEWLMGGLKMEACPTGSFDRVTAKD